MKRIRRAFVLAIIAVVLAISVAIPSSHHVRADDNCYPGSTPPCVNDEPFNDVGVWTSNPYAGYICVWGYTNNLNFGQWCITTAYGGYPNNNSNWYDPGWLFGGFHDLQVAWLYPDGTSTGYQHVVTPNRQFAEPWTSSWSLYFCIVYGGNPWKSGNWAYSSETPCQDSDPGAHAAGGYNPFNSIDYDYPGSAPPNGGLPDGDD